MEGVLVYCRPGFESEAGQELTDVAASRGGYGYFEPRQHQGWLLFHLSGGLTPQQLLDQQSIAELVFVRDWLIWSGAVALPAEDRVGAVIDALRGLEEPVPLCERVEVRLPENSTDRDLGNFTRQWVAPLSKGLRGAGLLAEATSASLDTNRLELLVPDFGQCFIGFSLKQNRARYPMGIPRLRLPAEAPSRSASKLEEAWKVLLPAGRELDYLGGGKTAVDLGAAPGGWTWQLVRQGMQVAAVDNGPMNDALMASGQVEHVKADGYQWRPRRAVDWMVCDIVDKPRRTAAMVAGWMTDRLCRYTIFNLKLPMKTRYQEWLSCQTLIEQQLTKAGLRFRLTAKQLYHDREEITCFIERIDG